MSAHTQGPWEVRSFVESMEHTISAPGWDDLAVVYGNEDDNLNKQGSANAHLIAAAPDLLKVARRWLRVMGRAGADVCACRMPGSPIDGPSGVMSPGLQDKGYVCCRCEIEAAIARAEGRQP